MIVQVSPTGFSAFSDPEGGVHQRTDVSERRVLSLDVPLRTGTTWYMRLGNWPWGLAALALLILSWWRTRVTEGARPLPEQIEVLHPARWSREVPGTFRNLQHQRDRAIVDELDLHLGPEPSGGDGGPQ